MSDCETLYNIIGGSVISILFIASELMPFTKKTKSNGLLHMLFLALAEHYSKPGEETEPLIEEV